MHLVKVKQPGPVTWPRCADPQNILKTTRRKHFIIMGPLTFTRESFNSILYTYTYDRTLYCNILNCTNSRKSGVWVGVSNLIICICAFNSLLIDAFLRRRILNICIIRVYIYVDLFTVLTRHGIIGVLAPVHRDHTRSPVGCVRHFSRQRMKSEIMSISDWVQGCKTSLYLASTWYESILYVNYVQGPAH